jgi:hypothetical protein
MVLSVVAIASVLGLAMLNTSALQVHAGANQAKLVSADYLAESGINIAMYYLQHPDRAPSLNADGYWAGMNGQYHLPNGALGTLVVGVTRDASDSWTYEVAASATISADGDGSPITRNAGARVYVRNEYVMKPGAAVSNNAITFNGPIITTGDVYSGKTMALKIGTSTPLINGAGYAPSWTTGVGYTTPRDGYRSLGSDSGTQVAPTNSDVNTYKTYDSGGTTYNASVLDALTSLLSGLLGILTRQPSASNPAGVVYKDARSGGAFVLNDNVTINGTLVVEGDLQVKGANITINPQPGFPALVVTGNVEIFQSGKSITTNGLTYIGGQLKSNGTPLLPSLASTFTVNGGLVFGSQTTTPIAASYNVKTTLNYNAAKAQAPELSSALRSSKGVSILRWGLPNS